MREWIADQAQYVLLACNDKTDINDRSAIVIKTFGDVEVFCERHNRFSAIARNMTMREYHGIPVIETPEEPLF